MENKSTLTKGIRKTISVASLLTAFKNSYTLSIDIVIWKNVMNDGVM